MELKDIFIGKASKYNHFEDAGTEQPAHACVNCIRRQYSYPYTCHDGWPMGERGWRDRGARCLNWTDQGNAPVD